MESVLRPVPVMKKVLVPQQLALLPLAPANGIAAKLVGSILRRLKMLHPSLPLMLLQQSQPQLHPLTHCPPSLPLSPLP
jgi:hypothetical protein